jgi:hypothetical protein
LQRIDPDWPFDVLELDRAEVGDRHVEPAADLAIGVLGETYRPGLANTLQSRGYVDAVAHEVAVAFFDDVAQMNADAEVYASLSRQAGVALGQAVLHFDGAADCVDHASKLDEAAVSRALYDPPVMRVDGRVDKIAPQSSEPRQRSLFVEPGEPAVTNDVGNQDRYDLPGPRLGSSFGAMQPSTKPKGRCTRFRGAAAIG